MYIRLSSRRKSLQPFGGAYVANTQGRVEYHPIFWICSSDYEKMARIGIGKRLKQIFRKRSKTLEIRSKIEENELPGPIWDKSGLQIPQNTKIPIFLSPFGGLFWRLSATFLEVFFNVFWGLLFFASRVTFRCPLGRKWCQNELQSG